MVISVTDVDKSIEFYKKVLHLKEIKNTASNSKTRWLSLGEGQQLHLIPRPGAEIKTNKAVHFALATSEVNAFARHLDGYWVEVNDDVSQE